MGEVLFGQYVLIGLVRCLVLWAMIRRRIERGGSCDAESSTTSWKSASSWSWSCPSCRSVSSFVFSRFISEPEVGGGAMKVDNFVFSAFAFCFFFGLVLALTTAPTSSGCFRF
jgi:hypothetical protein